MTEYLKVEGHANLVRDPNTNAILNSNMEEYRNYIDARKRKLDEMKRIEELESNVDHLVSEVSEVKDLLSKILDKL